MTCQSHILVDPCETSNDGSPLSVLPSLQFIFLAIPSKQMLGPYVVLALWTPSYKGRGGEK